MSIGQNFWHYKKNFWTFNSCQYFQLKTSSFWRRHLNGFCGLMLALRENTCIFTFWLYLIFRKIKKLKIEFEYDKKYPQCKANFNHDFPSFSIFLFSTRQHAEIKKYVARNENRNLKMFKTNLVNIKLNLLNKFRFSEFLQLSLATFTARMWGNPLTTNVPIIQKPFSWFAEQINWLVSIWWEHWSLKG